MDVKEILRHVDHTELSPTATWSDIQKLCDEAIACEAASVCVAPAYVKHVKSYVGNRIRITTVIGFPNGYATTAAKVFEASDAVLNGADEIDMVINVGALKAKDYDYVSNEIRTLKKLCGRRILKVIIETCLLTDDEKAEMCRIVTRSGADYIKTSTGFSTGGATCADIKLFAENVGPNVKIKAAGGISSFEDAEKFIALGASRLGTSRLVKIEKSQN